MKKRGARAALTLAHNLNTLFKLCVMIQKVFREGKLSITRSNETAGKNKKGATHCTAVSQGIVLALYLISVCLRNMARETGRHHCQNDVTPKLREPFFAFCLPYSENSDLLLGLCSGLLQLGLGLLQLALQSVASRLEVGNLRFPLLQRQGQLCHLAFNFQLLLLVLQSDLHGKMNPLICSCSQKVRGMLTCQNFPQGSNSSSGTSRKFSWPDVTRKNVMWAKTKK